MSYKAHITFDPVMQPLFELWNVFGRNVPLPRSRHEALWDSSVVASQGTTDVIVRKLAAVHGPDAWRLIDLRTEEFAHMGAWLRLCFAVGLELGCGHLGDEQAEKIMARAFGMYAKRVLRLVLELVEWEAATEEEAFSDLKLLEANIQAAGLFLCDCGREEASDLPHIGGELLPALLAFMNAEDQ